MPRYGAAWTVAAAGVAGATTCRPVASLFGVAGGGGHVVSVSLWNPASLSTASEYRICRITTAGTMGSTITAVKYLPNGPANACLAKDSHTATDCVVDANAVDVAVLGAAAGAGVILTFGDRGFNIDNATASGIGIVPVGTGQLIKVGFVWDE